MKRPLHPPLALMALICLCAPALSAGRISQAAALAKVKALFADRDVDYFQVSATLLTDAKEFFVDAEPMKGWQVV